MPLEQVALILGTMTIGLLTLALAVFSLQSRSRARRELQLKLLDRFGSSQELLAFLQTPEAREFLGNGRHRWNRGGQHPIIGSIRSGVTLIIIGGFGALISMAYGWHQPAPKPPFIFSVLILVVGLAFIVSAAISYNLTKRFGLLKPAEKE